MIVTKNKGLGSTWGMPDNLSEAKAMWCDTFPFFCSADTVAASGGLLNPDLYYPNPPTPPLAPPVDSTVADQWAEYKTRVQNFFNNLDTPPTDGSCTMNLGLGICDWMIYVGGAVGVILAFSAFSSRR
jgi:hypothetical protein